MDMVNSIFNYMINNKRRVKHDDEWLELLPSKCKEGGKYSLVLLDAGLRGRFFAIDANFCRRLLRQLSKKSRQATHC